MAAEQAADTIQNPLLKLLEAFSPEASGYGFMYIISFVFLIGMGFAIERIIYIVGKSSSGRANFLKSFGQLVAGGEYDQALSFAQKSSLPIAKVMAAIVANREKGREAMSNASDAVFLTEAPRLTRFVSIISVMASISTLLGLMGTIYGLIYTFDAVAKLPAAKRGQALSDGIAVAMGTTLLGLISAVPLLVIVGILNMNSERLIQEMEEKGLKTINSLS